MFVFRPFQRRRQIFFLSGEFQVHSTATHPETQDEENEGPEPDDDATEAGQDALYEHIKKVDERYDALAKDAATEEQAKEQLTVQDKEQDPVRKEEEECDDVTMQEDNQEPDQCDVDQVQPERMSGRNQKKGQQRGDPNTEEVKPDAKMEGTCCSLFQLDLPCSACFFSFEYLSVANWI